MLKIMTYGPILLLFLVTACKQKADNKATSATPQFAASSATGEPKGKSKVKSKDDFSDFEKATAEKDESCADTTVEDIEKELARKAKEAEKSGKTGFSFGGTEPGCDPNAQDTETKPES